MKSYKIILQIIFLMTLIAAFMIVRSYENPKIQMAANQIDNQGADYAERIKRLEPEIPLDIKEPPFLNVPFPSTVRPVSEVLENGSEIPLELIYSNLEWKRTAYKTYWHSTVSNGKWSYMPNRVYFAMHRLFSTYITSSGYYDFIHELGIEEESKGFSYNIAKPFEKVTVVVMQTDVQKIVAYGNQVLVVGKPQRNGLQVISVPVDKIKPDKSEDNILFQLITSSGDELDYSLISYAQWK